MFPGPVPERFRTEEIGQRLQDQAATVSKRSHARPEHATDHDRTLDALRAVERNKRHPGPPRHPLSAPRTRTERPTLRNRRLPRPAQTEKPHLMNKMERMIAERQAKQEAEQKPVEKAPKTEAQRQARLAAERVVREQ